MAAGYEVLIVGAGNLGLWTAYSLAKRGVRRIAVCERSWAGFGATSRSAGVIRQQGGSVTAITLGRLSRRLYLQVGEELRLDSGFIETGYFVLAGNDDEAALFHELVKLRQRCGVASEWVDPAEGRRRFPALNWDHFVGATYAPDDGYVHPPVVVRNITFATVRSSAIDLFERCEVTAIERRGDGFAVMTSRGRLEAGRVVAAAGPRGAREVGAMLGVEIPVSTTRHHVVTFATLSQEISQPFPMIFALGQGFYIRPEEQGALVGMTNRDETADHSGRYQLAFDWAYIDEHRPAWARIFPPLAGQPVSRAWAASIDYTPDHLPIIDEALPGFFVLAAGGHGMMWGPGLGLKLAELMIDGSVSELPAEEIRLSRFAAGASRPQDRIALPFPHQ